MIKEVTMYTVICDRCGKNNGEGAEYSAWGTDGDAECDAQENDWECIGNKENTKHYCPDCLMWNEDESELIPKPPTT